MLDYNSDRDLYRIGLENFQKIEHITTILDTKLTSLHNIPSLTPARYSILNLKFLIDSLWCFIHGLKTIIEYEHPDSLCLYSHQSKLSDPGVYVFSNDESVYADLLNLPGWPIPCKVIRRTNAERPKMDKISGIGTKRELKKYEILFNMGLIHKRGGVNAVGSALYNYITCLHRKPVLVYNNGYNWDDSLDELYKKGLLPVHRITDDIFESDGSAIKKYQEYVREICNTEAEFEEYKHILGIDVSSIFFERMSQIVGKSIEESIHAYNFTEKFLRKKRIQCLLHSTRNSAAGHAIVQASRDAGIPVISWQHGGAGYCYHPLMPYIEFINSDLHLVFGDAVADSFRETAKRLHLEKVPRFVSVGSSSLDSYSKMLKKIPQEISNAPLVYVTTNYLLNNPIISLPCEYCIWDEKLWSIQKKIINIAAKFPEKEFIIKLHPVHTDKEPLKSYASDRNVKNLKIISSEIPLSELCKSASVMVFDLISTGILQTLTSEIPVIVYTGLHDIDQDALTLLKKRAYLENDPNMFGDTIEKFLIDKFTLNDTIDCTNKEFLLKYGTDLATCDSAEVASILVKNAIEQRQPKAG